MDDLVARLKPSSYNLSLPSRERDAVLRRHALHCKYEKAVELYANTGMPLNAIARQCEVSVDGLGSYLRRYWRELVLRRHHIPAEGGALQDIKIIAVGQQNVNAHAKYKDAVRACEALDDIDLNVSQVARKFGLDGTALANFMRVHYPDILLRREEMRRRLGVNDNVLHGARPECIAQYAAAVELYRTTALTMAEVADRCHVSRSGLASTCASITGPLSSRSAGCAGRRPWRASSAATFRATAASMLPRRASNRNMRRPWRSIATRPCP